MTIIIPAQSRVAGAKSAKSSTAETFEGFAVEVFMAMLKAWPGMAHIIEGEPGRENAEIILPLPSENTNDKS